MEALEHELVFFQRSGLQKAVVEDAQNQGVEAMGDRRQGK